MIPWPRLNTAPATSSVPPQMISAARSLLKPGGALMIVSHNYRHWLMRLLGARSPIIDIEHLQVSEGTDLRRQRSDSMPALFSFLVFPAEEPTETDEDK